jgi:hypothetical protein
MGIADLSECDADDEALAIYKKMSEKATIKGYLPDGASMTVLEQVGKWYKIESGDIKGYVRTKYVIVDDAVEDSLLENKYITALITKESVPILNKAADEGVAVGMGYLDREYPIVGFSDDDKYVLIERTETISGWVPLSSIKIQITAPTAMTEDEYEDYKLELEAKEQEALQSYLNLKVSSTGDPLQDKIIQLISHNESGNYKAARNPITSGEKTITVGAWQWYGENAHRILKMICAADSKKAKEILEGAFTGKKAKEKYKKLYDDILSGDNWETSRRIFTNAELVAIKDLLGSDQGVNVQNTKIQSDIQAKIKVAINTYNLTNDALIVYFCDLFWQNPHHARDIVNECIKHYKGTKKFSEAEDGLKFMHKTAMNNGVMSRYSRRRNYTYSYCKSLIK